AASHPMRSKAPKSKAPMSPRSGSETIDSGRVGTLRFHPAGFGPASGKDGPILKSASTMIATIVVATLPMSSAPLTFRAISTPMVSRPTMKITVGMVVTEPPSPSCTGGGGAARTHEAGVDEADEGDEEADAHRDGGLQLCGH